MYELLDTIDSPKDIKGLSIGQLRELCTEIRSYMIDCCSRTPGHLASSLGAVELIVGLHYVYDTPSDKIVFDVGHQAYAHKILTGRREAFKNLRTEGGISGFPKMEESPYDAFSAGHSSTSISAALGLAEAAKIKGTSEKAVAFIGDGAFTGGLALEGLNNAGASNADLLIILNDNNQSIDKNTGALHNHLLNITTSATYNRLKDRVWNNLGDHRMRNFLQRWLRSLKSWIVKRTGGDIFESFGFRYFGPIDGNDIEQVVSSLRKIKSLNGPRVLHCMTVKGKGYAPAEADPTVWHAPGRFNPETGERIRTKYSADRYQDVFGEVLLELAKMDCRVVGVTPAMASGCGMNIFGREMPQRFFDVGIEEEHAVTFSAGMAAGGLRPFCNIYSSFSQRAYDQIVHDVALQRLPVVLCLDRAGLVGEDGATHNGSFDLSAYRSIPNAVIAAPSDELELRNLMYTALQSSTGPFIIRYPRGIGEGVEWRGAAFKAFEVGKGSCVLDGSGTAILALGPMVGLAKKAAFEFESVKGRRPAVYDMRFLKPLDRDLLEEVAADFTSVITIEDGTLSGGLYGAVCEFMEEKNHKNIIRGIGIGDEFVLHATQNEEREHCGMTVKNIVRTLESLL